MEGGQVGGDGVKDLQTNNSQAGSSGDVLLYTQRARGTQAGEQLVLFEMGRYLGKLLR